MRPSRRILTIAASTLILITTISAAIPRAFNPQQAAADAPPIAFLIDCDTTTPGVQSNCVYPSGTTSVDVDVVIQNSGPAFKLAGFEFTALSSPRSVFTPQGLTCSPPHSFDCNPKPGPAVALSNWQCGPPEPTGDTARDGNPGTSESYMNCFSTDQQNGPAIPTSGSLTLATIRYSVVGDIFADLSMTASSAYDDTFSELGSCLPVRSIPMECGASTVQVGTNPTTPTFTPSITPTPSPTSTPTPARTPSTTPTGAVTDIVALNEGICITGAAVLRGVPAVTAAFACQEISFQYYLQTFVTCLLHDPRCLNQQNPNEVLVRPQPADFASIDLDEDSVQQEQPLEIIAFVSGDYPVLFETNIGMFLTPQGAAAGQELFCGPGSPQYPGLSLDPDCDANLATIGDGVVAVRLVTGETDPRGDGTVTVTQNGIAKQLQFTVTGSAKTISFESLDGKDEIETAGTEPCTAMFTDPVTGSTSPDKTSLFVRALDEDGVPVFGASVLWDKVYGRADAPRGGSATFGSPTWLFAGRGAGAVLTVCGGHAAGALTVEGRFDVIFAPRGDRAYRSSVTIQVVPAPNFCVDIGAPWQRNQNSEIMEVPGKDDVTNPAGDFVIDDCDSDLDGDGIPNDQELALRTFPDYWDSDFDLTSDGAEVRCGSDPLSSASNISGADTDNDRLPDSCEVFYGADPVRFDTDGDGLPDGVEVRYWLSDPTKVNTDSDNCSDGREVATVNGDRTVNVADFGIIASKFGPVPAYDRPFDQNGDGVLNMADLGFAASKKGACITLP